MAGKPGGGKGGGGGGGTVDKAQLKVWLKQKIQEEVDTLRREKQLDLILLNKALGVGNMETFTKEFENEYDKSSQEALRSAAGKKEEKDSIYGNPKESRPRLKKISTEIKPTVKNKNKGGK